MKYIAYEVKPGGSYTLWLAVRVTVYMRAMCVGVWVLPQK